MVALIGCRQIGAALVGTTMASITTHILNTAIGRPAAGVAITLSRLDGDAVVLISSGVTDEDGRLKTLSGAGVAAGTYRLSFAVAAYFGARNERAFYPQADITFVIDDDKQHYHVPLLLQPFGFSTYRGS
jgi:5-hydroxyisourate hydrolase